MLLRVIDDDHTYDVVEVSFERGKYLRRKDDVVYLHVNKDDQLVDWADSSHTLNEWFEFTVEPKTHVIRTHEGHCIIWETEFGSLVKADYPHPRAVTMEPEQKKWLSTAKLNFMESMSPMIPETLTTKRDKMSFLNDMWKNMTKDEKLEYY